jgi:hypothetical protein
MNMDYTGFAGLFDRSRSCDYSPNMRSESDGEKVVSLYATEAYRPVFHVVYNF